MEPSKILLLATRSLGGSHRRILVPLRSVAFGWTQRLGGVFVESHDVVVLTLASSRVLITGGVCEKKSRARTSGES